MSDVLVSQVMETPVLGEKVLFDLAKVIGHRTKISQIHPPQKAKVGGLPAAR